MITPSYIVLRTVYVVHMVPVKRIGQNIHMTQAECPLRRPLGGMQRIGQEPGGNYIDMGQSLPSWASQYVQHKTYTSLQIY